MEGLFCGWCRRIPTPHGGAIMGNDIEESPLERRGVIRKGGLRRRPEETIEPPRGIDVVKNKLDFASPPASPRSQAGRGGSSSRAAEGGQGGKGGREGQSEQQKRPGLGSPSRSAEAGLLEGKLMMGGLLHKPPLSSFTEGKDTGWLKPVDSLHAHDLKPPCVALQSSVDLASEAQTASSNSSSKNESASAMSWFQAPSLPSFSALSIANLQNGDVAGQMSALLPQGGMSSMFPDFMKPPTFSPDSEVPAAVQARDMPLKDTPPNPVAVKEELKTSLPSPRRNGKRPPAQLLPPTHGVQTVSQLSEAEVEKLSDALEDMAASGIISHQVEKRMYDRIAQCDPHLLMAWTVFQCNGNEKRFLKSIHEISAL